MNQKNLILFGAGAVLCWMLLRHYLPAADPIPAQAKGPQPALSPLRVGGKPPVPVLNIAHRGACAFAPENTLESFRKAVDLKCDMIELDVHVSSDGKLIVVHDEDLLRCSDVKTKFPKRTTYFVSDFTAAEIRTLDAGSWFIEELKKPAKERDRFLQTLKKEEEKEFITPADRKLYASGKVRHPTLREVLEFAQSAKVLVNIEPKTLPRQYPGLTADIVKLVEELKMEREVIISSFDHEALVEVRKLSKIIATAALVSDRLHRPGHYVREILDADAYNPGCYSDYDVFGFNSVNGKLTVGSLKDARAAGLGVNVWTEDDPERMRQLIKAGATGIITNYPSRLRAVLAEKSEIRNPKSETNPKSKSQILKTTRFEF